MADEHLYIVTYDIGDDRRWRAVFKLMHGYGEWMQLSVFQCRLTRARALDLQAKMTATLHPDQDHVMMVDVGPADSVQPRIISLGKRPFEPIARVPIIV